jgi:dTDP-4-dehydrorhamnose 3,5-epimerase
MSSQELQRDRQTVTPEGEPVDQVPAGVCFHDVPIQIDERGSLREIYDLRWNFHPDPLVYCYYFTVRPGIVKGWAMHKRHDDRYFIISGEVEVVLYDDRPESPTCGLLAKVVLSEYRGRLMSIPAGVWHADRNIGSKDVVAINFPTIPYDHENPDKYRLPLDTDRIPYKFERPTGW